MAQKAKTSLAFRAGYRACEEQYQARISELEQRIKELEANQINGRCKDCKHAVYCEWLASDGSGYCSEFEPRVKGV